MSVFGRLILKIDTTLFLQDVMGVVMRALLSQVIPRLLRPKHRDSLVGVLEMTVVLAGAPHNFSIRVHLTKGLATFLAI